MLTAAVIGCGRMGAEPSSRFLGYLPAGWAPLSHAECLHDCSEIRLVALADSDESKLEKFSQHYGVEALYTDYRDLLREIRPDFVSIATRTPVKSEIALEAILCGAKILYIEKPLANSMIDCSRIIHAAEESGTIIGYGVNRRHHAVYRQAREIIDNGEIGEIVEIRIDFGYSSLLWTHPHSVDLMLFFTHAAAAVDVCARLTDTSISRKSPRNVDSDPLLDFAHFSFSNGVRGTIGRGAGCNVSIIATRGELKVHADGSYIQLSSPRKGSRDYFLNQTFIHAHPNSGATHVAFQELVRAVKTSHPPPITHVEIEMGLRMLLACVWSQFEGNRPVPVTSVPTDLFVSGRTGDLYA